GVSAVAKLLLAEGVEVSGSDANRSAVTEELEARGVRVSLGHDAANLPEGVGLVVRTSAVPDDNPELEAARERGIPDLTYFEFLGRWSRGRRTVAVAGTNGKSTTTAMLGMMLAEAGLDPTVIVGSKVPAFPDGNLRLGRGELFVVEACEHEAHLLEFAPQSAVVTNIEEDHLDFYHDREHIMTTFRQFVSQVEPDGFVVLNADDESGSDALEPAARTVRFGSGSRGNPRWKILEVGEGVQRFSLQRDGSALGEFDLHVPGRFNVENAVAAATVALELGVPPESIRAALDSYRGIWRRFEIVGEPYGAPVISDYGHHPTAVAGTLQAVREFYPNKKIVLVFQPHHRNRTRNLFDRFVPAFDGADAVILPEIYDVTGREDDADGDISSRDLVHAVRQRDLAREVRRPVRYAESLDAAFALIHSVLEPQSVCLVMGAGDVDELARRLVGTE
ncbi:UDP-N-acetylmuramate--L-alanine ligase, partial [Patescibacteria group bacterium]